MGAIHGWERVPPGQPRFSMPFCAEQGEVEKRREISEGETGQNRIKPASREA